MQCILQHVCWAAHPPLPWKGVDVNELPLGSSKEVSLSGAEADRKQRLLAWRVVLLSVTSNIKKRRTSILLQGRALYGPIPVKTETFRKL